LKADIVKCPTCKQDVEVVSETVDSDQREMLSCGHKNSKALGASIFDSANPPTTLNDVLYFVDRNDDYTEEQKEKIKQILQLVDKEKDRMTLAQFGESLKSLKPWIKESAPWVTMLVMIYSSHSPK